MCKKYTWLAQTTSDCVLLKHNDPFQKNGTLVKASAGDMILWDSRTVHGGIVGTGPKLGASKGGAPTLARLTLTVCMTKRDRSSKVTLKLR